MTASELRKDYLYYLCPDSRHPILRGDQELRDYLFEDGTNNHFGRASLLIVVHYVLVNIFDQVSSQQDLPFGRLYTKWLFAEYLQELFDCNVIPVWCSDVVLGRLKIYLLVQKPELYLQADVLDLLLLDFLSFESIVGNFLFLVQKGLVQRVRLN